MKYLLPALLLFSVAQGQSLPKVYVNANKAVITREAKVPAFMTITDGSYSDSITIKGRGNSSWVRFDKKPYSIELNIKKSVLGMPANSDWALIANMSDKTLLRNKLAYYLGSRALPWSPRNVSVEFYLDSVYRGVYSFTERIKQDVNRVNVSSDGFILEVDQRDRIDKGDTFFIAQKTALLFGFTYPKIKNLTTDKYNYIRSYIDSFETALYGPNFKDTVNGYARYIDIPTFVDYYIIQLHARTTDLFFSSTFFYKDKNKKLCAGPLWDFDISYGNVNYNNDFSTAGYNYRMVWFGRLIQDSAFQYKVNKRLFELKPMLDSIPAFVQNWGNNLSQSGGVARNFAKWPVLGVYIWPNYAPYPTTYQGELDRLKSWSTARLQWMMPVDNVKPTITCPAPVTYCNGSAGSYTIAPLKAIDNYFVKTVTYTVTGATIRSGTGLNASGVFNKGVSTITWTVTDQSGNMSTCQSTVNVNTAVTAVIPDAKALNTGVDVNTVYTGYTPASSITLVAQGAGGAAPYTYKWSNGATTASIAVSPVTVTNYSVIVTDAKGCTGTAVKQVKAVNVSSSNNRIKLCHKGDNKEIVSGDVSSHLGHGDYLGECKVVSGRQSNSDNAGSQFVSGNSTNYYRGSNNMQGMIDNSQVIEATQQQSELSIKATPNPSSNYFTLVVKGNSEERVSITVMDAMGRAVEKRSVSTGTLKIGNTYHAGNYVIEIVQGENRKTLKLMKTAR